MSVPVKKMTIGTEVNIKKLGQTNPDDAQKKNVVDPTADEWPHSYLAEIQQKCRRVNIAP